MAMSGGRVAPALVPALTAALLLACVREPLDEGCSDLAPGDLVITELRGAQSGSYRQWVEVYNATDAPVPAAGLRFEFTGLDGDNFFAFFVRDDTLTIAPGGYLVVGGGAPEDNAYIDYDYTPDHHSGSNAANPADIYSGGILDLSLCERPLDRVIYKLPLEGTLSLDGSAPPDAATNDQSDDGWCADITPGAGPKTGIGLNGTPGEANPPCP